MNKPKIERKKKLIFQGPGPKIKLNGKIENRIKKELQRIFGAF